MAKAIGVVAGALSELSVADLPFVETSADLTLTAAHYFAAVSAAAAARAVTLPAASSVPAGRAFKIKKSDTGANAVTVGRAGLDTIDGATSIALGAQAREATVVSNGVDRWHVTGFWPGLAGKYSALIGDNAALAITVTQATHGRAAARTNVVQLLEEATGAVAEVNITLAANGDVTFTFAAAPTAGQYRVNILG